MCSLIQAQDELMCINAFHSFKFGSRHMRDDEFLFPLEKPHDESGLIGSSITAVPIILRENTNTRSAS